MDNAIVQVNGLFKQYGPKTAVDHVSFEVADGEIFGILGPNGAGKTTTLEMIEGIRVPDGGTAIVDGLDVRKHRRRVQQNIGVQLQVTTLFDKLTVAETVRFFAALYPRSVPVARLMDDFALNPIAKDYASDLSGGQRQRLSMALALVNDPRVVFLDEPSTGLDPQSRRAIWEVVKRLRQGGKTVVLTTHYMEEAEVLCDRVAIMDDAKIIALDTPQAMIDSLKVDRTIECRLSGEITVKDLEGLPAVRRVNTSGDDLVLQVEDLEVSMSGLIRLVDARGAKMEDLRVHSPSLEDVFLNLTGKWLRN